MNCPNCKSENIVKYGRARQKQRFLCKQCATQFTEQSIIKSKSQLIMQKRHALILFLLGMSYRNIGEMMELNHMTVFKWLQPYEDVISRLKAAEAPKLLSIKEVLKRLGKQQSDSIKFLCIDFKTAT